MVPLTSLCATLDIINYAVPVYRECLNDPEIHQFLRVLLQKLFLRPTESEDVYFRIIIDMTYLIWVQSTVFHDNVEILEQQLSVSNC